MAKTRYSFVQRLLHWLIALLIFGLLAMGFTFWFLGYEGVNGLFGDELTNTFYMAHKSFGILLFFLVVLRLLLFRFSPVPEYPTPLTGVERVVSTTTHVLMYLLLIGIPVGGWLATAISGFPIQFFGWSQPGLDPANKELGEQLFLMHGIGGAVLLAVLLLHIGAGLKHWKLKDGIMTRISLP
ncbi:MAG: cytochrome b/b6 domain-containing protein [Chromatiaceae bacterium]|nr:cytochrome b/b6 domain-containing protein [Chromatiaceae bacterium]MCF7995247.1 cytochrome b/b6 domain-containing protein [Chromatiaceae bacterium]MCF8004150.1 cytochrome b/b6 domain-containing protein [Chromatiaceae bacterium]